MRSIKIYFGALLFNSLLTNLTLCAQAALGDSLAIKVLSGNKMIYQDKEGLHRLFAVQLKAQMPDIEKNLSEWISGKVRYFTGDKLTAHNIVIEMSTGGYSSINPGNWGHYLGGYRLEIFTGSRSYGQSESVHLRCFLPRNRFSFKVTTPDVLGIGLSKDEDPTVYVEFDLSFSVGLSQTGLPEGVQFYDPDWSIHVTRYAGKKLSERSFSERSLKYFLAEMSDYYPRTTKIFRTFNTITQDLNMYIQTMVLRHPDLLKEFEIDEDRRLQVTLDPATNSLVFSHPYSQTGIVKRAATKDAGIIAEGPKSTTQPPVRATDSPSGINKKADVIKGMNNQNRINKQ